MTTTISMYTNLRSATTTARGTFYTYVGTQASSGAAQQIFQLTSPNNFSTTDNWLTYMTAASNATSLNWSNIGYAPGYGTYSGRYNSAILPAPSGTLNTSTNSINTTGAGVYIPWTLEGADIFWLNFCWLGGADVTSPIGFDTFRVSTPCYDITYNFEPSIALTSVTGAGTIMTCASTVGLQPGYLMGTVTGTGTFAAGTYVTGVISQTQFVINTAPTVALASASVTALGEWAVGGTSTGGSTTQTLTGSTTGTGGMLPGSTVMPLGGGGSTGSTGYSSTGYWTAQSNKITNVTSTSAFVTAGAPSVALSAAPLVINNTYLNWKTNSANNSTASGAVQQYMGQAVYLSATSSSTTTVTCGSTAFVFPGMKLFIISGTGTLAAGSTYVTSVLSATQFTISQTPTAAFVSANLLVYIAYGDDITTVGKVSAATNSLMGNTTNGPAAAQSGSRFLQTYNTAISAYYWLTTPAFPNYGSPFACNYSQTYITNLYPPYSYMKYAEVQTAANLAATVTATYSSGGSISTNTFVVASATGIAIGQYVSGTGTYSGAGVTQGYYQVTNVVGTTITLSANLLAQAAGTYTFYNFTPLRMPQWVNQPTVYTSTNPTGPTYSIASMTTNGSQTTTTITVTSIPQGLQVGAPIIVASGGTGSFPAGTVITAINSATTFTVSNAPSVTIPTGQTLLLASTNTNGGLPPGLSLNTSTGGVTGTLDISTMTAGLNSYYFSLRCDFYFNTGSTGTTATGGNNQGTTYYDPTNTYQWFPGSNTGNFVFEVYNTSSAMSTTVINPVNDMAVPSVTYTGYLPSSSAVTYATTATLTSVNDMATGTTDAPNTNPKRTSVIVIG